MPTPRRTGRPRGSRNRDTTPRLQCPPDCDRLMPSREAGDQCLKIMLCAAGKCREVVRLCSGQRPTELPRAGTS
jgi:hypothetical protein